MTMFREYTPVSHRAQAILLNEENITQVAEEIGGWEGANETGTYYLNNWGKSGYFKLTIGKYLVKNPQGGYHLVGRDEFDSIWSLKTTNTRATPSHLIDHP